MQEHRKAAAGGVEGAWYRGSYPPFLIPQPLRLTLHYVSRSLYYPTNHTFLSVQYTRLHLSYCHQSVSTAISYQTIACVGRYNSHYTFSRENMSWRLPATPPHHQTLQTSFHSANRLFWATSPLASYMQHPRTDMHDGCFVYIYLSQSS